MRGTLRRIENIALILLHFLELALVLLAFRRGVGFISLNWVLECLSIRILQLLQLLLARLVVRVVHY